MTRTALPFEVADISALARSLAQPAAPAADMTRVAQTLRHFDEAGRLLRWPGKTWQQHLAVWALWAHVPCDTALTERQASALLNDWHGFGDAAILRRTMVERGLLTRVPGGNEYRRVESPPPPEARALIRHLHGQGQA